MNYPSKPTYYMEIDLKHGHWVGGNFRDREQMREVFARLADFYAEGRKLRKMREIIGRLADFYSGHRELCEMREELEAREYWWLE